VDQQSWDPSVKALTQFPSVLHDLAKNLSWTSSLGQAFTNQQSDVMAAVQVMRARAQAAGTLQSSPQIKVVQQGAQTIVIQPADASVVYVPQYNPAVVYGAPIIVPAYTPPVVVAAGVSFGAGVAIGAAFGGGGFVGGGFGGGAAWGFGAWGCNWGGGGGGGNINYNHNTYINRTVINRTVINRNTNNTANNWNNGSRPGEPNGGRNGDHGLIGGNGGIQHQPGVGDRGNTFNDQRTRSAMSGNGEQHGEIAHCPRDFPSVFSWPSLTRRFGPRLRRLPIEFLATGTSPGRRKSISSSSPYPTLSWPRKS
jgi:hypothetical protein